MVAFARNAWRAGASRTCRPSRLRNVLQRLGRSPRPAFGERSKFARVTRGFRVRGHLRVGGVTDRDITIAFNHRLRVVFSGAPSPGVRTLHVRTPSSKSELRSSRPRARGEVRNSRAVPIFPGTALPHKG